MAKDDYVNDQQSRARDSAYTEIELYGKVISQSIIKAIGGQAIADQMANSYKSQLAYMKSLNKKSGSGGGSDEDVAASATPTDKKVSLGTGSGTGSTYTNGSFYEMDVASGIEPKAILDKYKAGQITYSQLESWLNKFGYSPAQFGIKK